VAALVWLGQQSAARSDVRRVLLGRLSPSTPASQACSARRPCVMSLTAGQDRGLVVRDRLLGHVWAVTYGYATPPSI
jgi:hypothetical protein